MPLFRKKALDSLSNPENLKEPMRLLNPGFWSLLISLIGFSTFILTWSIFGRLPVRIKGQGILYSSNTIFFSQPKISARVKNVNVKTGDCVFKDDVLALLDSDELEIEKKKIKRHLDKITLDSKIEYELETSQLELKKKELDRYYDLLINGAVSKMNYEKIELEFKSLKANIVKNNNQREQLIFDKKLNLQKIDDQIKSHSMITSNIDGCIIGTNVKIGQYVNSGDKIFQLTTENKDTPLTSFAFLPTRDGKRIKVGQIVKITPTTTNKQRHGGISGEVISVNSLPITRDDLLTKFGNEIVVSKLLMTDSEPMIQIMTSLNRDANSISGYDWGGGKGADLNLTSGTMTNVSIIVERRRPITYMIPLLRDLSGIY